MIILEWHLANSDFTSKLRVHLPNDRHASRCAPQTRVHIHKLGCTFMCAPGEAPETCLICAMTSQWFINFKNFKYFNHNPRNRLRLCWAKQTWSFWKHPCWLLFKKPYVCLEDIWEFLSGGYLRIPNAALMGSGAFWNLSIWEFGGLCKPKKPIHEVWFLKTHQLNRISEC